MQNNYDDIPAIRRSELWQAKKSPAHYRYAVTHPTKDTPALLFGRAAHKYILETDKFYEEFALAPEVDRRTKTGKEEYARFLRDLGDKTPINIKDYIVIEEMNDAVLQNPVATSLLKTGRHEVPIEWADLVTGELCKCRPDCITEYAGSRYIVDYKTTTSCEDFAFERECRKYGYKLQAAMYTEGMWNTTMEDYKFAFVAQEKDPPYLTRVYFCDQGFIDEGMSIFRELIDLVHKCKETDSWPGYEDKELYGDE